MLAAVDPGRLKQPGVPILRFAGCFEGKISWTQKKGYFLIAKFLCLCFYHPVTQTYGCSISARGLLVENHVRPDMTALKRTLHTDCGELFRGTTMRTMCLNLFLLTRHF